MNHIEISQYKKVLFITAHPDDLEGFAGGLVNLLNSQAKVYEIILSRGNNGRWEEKYIEMNKREFEHIRYEEAHKGAKVLGVDRVTTFHFHDREIPAVNATVQKLKDKIFDIAPDAIFSFEYRRFFNYDPHPDHLAVGILTKKAVHSLNGKEMDYFVFTTTTPDYLIDITKVRKLKIRALNCHKSQRRLSRIIFPFLEYIPCRALGLINRSWYAEGYRKVKL